MTRKEFIAELHQLYIEDIDHWMKERFEENDLHAELKEDKENALKRAIIKNNGMDYDYLEWALEGQQECGLSFEDQLSSLEDSRGLLSSFWDNNTDEENEEIFNRYKKYYDTIPMEEFDKLLHRKIVMMEVDRLKTIKATPEEVEEWLKMYGNDTAEEIRQELKTYLATAD